MRRRLLELLRCPSCRSPLTSTPFATAEDGEVVEGLLHCGCGTAYPVVDTIPRMLGDALDQFPEFRRRYADRLAGTGPSAATVLPQGVERRTQRSFGYQWTTYSEMSCDFRENFWTYLRPATPEFFHGRLGLDAGCGFGRHIYHAASYGAEMVGVDFSRAIDATRKNTRHLPNVHLVQADIYRLPFSPGTFDFVYSVGVLHHLPQPPRGFAALAAFVRPGGMLFVWVYSSKRRIVNFLLEAVRGVTTRLPHPLLRACSWIGAAADWAWFVVPYRVARRVPGLRGIVERLMPARIKLYSGYPFQVMEADWFDRLAAPVRFYYDEPQVRALVEAAGLSDIVVTATGLYGWRACGIKPFQAVGAVDEAAQSVSA